MSYIGNNLQTAFPSYLNIDDISGSFNGVTTSFALTVGGSAPVPAPASSNQCLISVGGVVQRPDDTGTEGFLLSGGNIVFSSAPGTGEDFFGVVLAGADYLNVGVNYPSGTAAAPSITFDTDLDTGIYNPGANEIGLTTAGVNRVTIDSSGNVNVVNNLVVDTNTLYVDATNNRVGIGTSSPSYKLDVSGNGRFTTNVDITNANANSYIYFGRTGTNAQAWSIGNADTSLNIFNQTSFFTAMSIDSSGRLLVGTTSSLTYSSNLQVKTTSTYAASFYDGSGNLLQLWGTSAAATGWSVSDSITYLGKVNATSRSINAAGTVNASGADYAEYMTKAGDFNIAKGSVCGVTSEGLLTLNYNDAVSFVVKSTNPSYVGGDTWGSEDVVGPRPDVDDTDALTQWQADLEAARQKVDRIAFAGQVPVNVMSATPGQYIVPIEAADGGIEGIAKNEADLTLTEYMRAVGKVIAIEDDGRARIIVKVA